MFQSFNDDFAHAVCVHAAQQPWLPSPMPGVDRIPLDRVCVPGTGGEVARATSVVRYAPGSRFSPHVHEGGEEILVLSGVFEDEHGHYPQGSYLRNPPGSAHSPGSGPGCTIFVKLRQFAPRDLTSVRRSAASAGRWDAPDVSALSEACTHTLLHEFEGVRTGLLQLVPGSPWSLDVSQGAEVFVLEGAGLIGVQSLHTWSWVRLPSQPGTLARLEVSKKSLVWYKTGHLVCGVDGF